MLSAEAETEERIERVAGAALFATLNREALRGLALRSEVLALADGAALVREGDRAEALFIVLEGALEQVSRRAGGAAAITTLEPGAVLGELAFLAGGRHPATVAARGPARVLRIPGGAVEALAAGHPDLLAHMTALVSRRLRRRQLAELLPRVFGALDDAVLEALEAEVEWVSLRRGEHLFRQGDPGDSLYFLLGGRLHVRIASARDGERVVNELAAGASVGEMALISGDVRSATVSAARDCALAKLSRASFDAFRERHPSIPLGIARVLAERVKQKDALALAPRPALVSTIALLPLGRGVDLGAFAARLAAALGAFGPATVLSSAAVAGELGIPAAAERSPGDPLDVRLRAWLEGEEARHRFTIYQADPEPGAFTRRAIRSADRVLLVGRAGDPPGRTALEAALFDGPEAAAAAGTRCALVLLHPDGRERPRGTAAWLDARVVDRHHHVRLDRDDDVARVARFLAGRSVGLVLSGGGARAAAHIGVLRALEELAVPVDLIVGASSGAGVGGQYALGFGPDRLIEHNEHVWRHVRPHRAFAPPVLSLVGRRGLDRAARDVAGDADVADTWIPFRCVSTNLSSGSLVVHERGPLWKALRATAALPGIFEPVVEKGELLVDGGVLDNLPWRVAKALHEGPTIAVDVSGEGDLRTAIPYEELPSSWRVLWSWLLPFGPKIDVPSAIQVVLRSASVSSVALRERCASEVQVLVRPDVGRYGMLEFSAIRPLAEAGHRAAQDQVGPWWARVRAEAARAAAPPADAVPPGPRPLAPPDHVAEAELPMRGGGRSEQTISAPIRDQTAAVRRRAPHLLAILGSAAGRSFKLEKRATTIGRAPTCDIRLDDECVSRLHATVERDPAGGFELVDGGSTNGCFYSGERFARRRLAEGDKVQIGAASVLKFTYQDPLDEAFHREQYDRLTRCGLTRAFRREHFTQQLARDFAFAQRHQEPLGLVLFDVDHFKRVNDTHGHPAGDMVLRRLAEIAGESLRTEDLLARVGGEEFAVLLRAQERARCIALAERLRGLVEAAVLVFEGTRIPVTISMGLATLEDGPYADPDALVAAADRRLYAAKRGGRNRVVAAD